jgi:hypothetical protein
MDTLLWPALGGSAPKMTKPTDEAEARRTITAMLLHGSPVIGVDNIVDRLDSASLASTITESLVVDRPVRGTVAVVMSARRIWVFVGNNFIMSAELARRTVHIRIDPGVEHPERRSHFKYPHLRRSVAAMRTQLLHDILVLCRGWVAAGCPLGTQRIGSFESWAEVIGGFLQTAGIPGFLEDQDVIRAAADPEEVAWKGLMGLAWEEFADRSFGIGELTDLLVREKDLATALGLPSTQCDQLKIRLGKRILSKRDCIYDGRRLVLAGSVRGANRWRFCPL